MPVCASCAGEAAEGSRFCPSCGEPLETPTSAPTETSLKSERPGASVSSLGKARFIPGTVLAKRYRIISLLGRGGMGEVYRADDLKLGQPVALKFLPSDVQRDRARLDRFLNEVKTALQVTHPNVCRVYDIGEVDGQHYISMEYVDGEDLASLLRRIGRLPQDKAVQIARQLCAGLAAAHEQGILHRDLKPANVMIDGRGRAKITDFGLAGLAEGIEGDEVRAGTPAYMSPEQLAGKEVTVRSDLYALGLVLYELFTGKRAFDAATPAEMLRLERESTPSSPSSHVEGLDPAVERAILRCLERDPADRPVSVAAAVAALPGGDPLATALAAGETPSPEIVAAAGERGAMRPVWAAICLAMVFVGILVQAILGPTSLYGRASLSKSCAALEENARTIARDLGYHDDPADRAAWFEIHYRERELAYRSQEDLPAVEGYDPASRMVAFMYRQSPRPMTPSSLSGKVNSREPPLVTPGELYLWLDVQGRMVLFQAVPPDADFSEEARSEMDWSGAFRAAGLQMEDFTPVPPSRLPPVYATERMAWVGEHPHYGGLKVRIEAAALNEQIVYFENVLPWDSYWSAETFVPEQAIREPVLFLFGLLALLALVTGAVVVFAVRHLRSGRGDRRGAVRLAVIMGAAFLLHWVLAGHHVASYQELWMLIRAVGGAASLAIMTWLFYIAFEPYVRRFWPEAIISWSRMLAGRVRDPLVGRDLLIGLAVGAALTLLTFVVVGPILWVLGRPDVLPPSASRLVAEALIGGRFLLAQVPRALLYNLPTAFVLLVLLLVFRLLLRKLWLAAVTYCLITGVLNGLQFGEMADERNAATAISIGILIGLMVAGLAVVLLIRFGLLAMLAYSVSAGLITYYPLTVETSVPYFGAGLVGALVLAAFGVWAYRTALAGRSLFGEARGPAG